LGTKIALGVGLLKNDKRKQNHSVKEFIYLSIIKTKDRNIFTLVGKVEKIRNANRESMVTGPRG